MERSIILASGSPRRKELLSLITKEYGVKVSDCDETLSGTETPGEAVRALAYRKAMAVGEELSGEEPDKKFLIIGADTVVSLSGRIIGKPTDEDDAIGMLTDLSGRTHEVFTGVCILLADNGGVREYAAFEEKTEVHFTKITSEEIRSYVNTGEPMDKAGAYGIQGYGARFIDGISGDYFNVVGLPVARLYQSLKEFL